MLSNVVLEKTLQSPLDSKEINPSIGDQSNQSILQEINPIQGWLKRLIEKTDAEAEAPILRLSDVKRQLIGKDPDAGRDWR